MKIDTIREKATKHPLGTTIGPFELDLDAILTDPTFQVRFRLDDTNKGRIKAAYKSGAEVAPIVVAFIEGGEELPVIIDGHHRVNVLETLAAEASVRGGTPVRTVQAYVVRLTREEARFQAAAANTKHGLNLSRAESRRVLARYVEAKHHRKPDGTYKSYREIGKELARTHNTISAWMKADFPAEAMKMENKEMIKAGGLGAPAPLILAKHRMDAALLEVRNIFDYAPSGDRADALRRLWSLLEDLEAVHSRTDAFMHDMSLASSSGPPNSDDTEF